MTRSALYYLPAYTKDQSWMINRGGSIVNEFNTGLPGIRRIQRAIQNKDTVEVKLNTGDTFTGTVRWQDPEWICLAQADEQEILVGRTAVAYLKATT